MRGTERVALRWDLGVSSIDGVSSLFIAYELYIFHSAELEFTRSGSIEFVSLNIPEVVRQWQ